MTALIIHGHFYQPPRENPWTGKVEQEIGAAPYHDWNERIHAECYAPNAWAKVIGPSVERTINNYEHISFNFGPTLMSWLERHHLPTHERILEADRTSALARGGHGNAIAQAYGHAILPLCNDRDRLTQVLWGIADFKHRFRREPEALWLPETACDKPTLDLLIDQGLRFVILAPHQAARYKLPGSEAWQSTDVDTSRAYRYIHQDGSSRSIAIFFYDGPASRAIAFDRALSSSEVLVQKFKEAAARGPMVNVATDGETYGHHFKFGDLCLAHTIEVAGPRAGFEMTNYGEFLDQHPAEAEVEIDEGRYGEGTSWSCIHGVSRWTRDCGCHTGGTEGWNQAWRAPLRAALNLLRDHAAVQVENVGGDLFVDPWDARNAYIEVILYQRAREDFLRRHVKYELSRADADRALSLLEMQRHVLLMFASCGWFFSEISGIESLQVLKYAARVIELLEELKLPSGREDFLEVLSEAKSNRPEFGTGADIFRRLVENSVGVKW